MLYIPAARIIEIPYNTRNFVISRTNENYTQKYIPLQVICTVSKLAYRIYVILIANKRVTKKKKKYTIEL
jgi:hypothetical protein